VRHVDRIAPRDQREVSVRRQLDLVQFVHPGRLRFDADEIAFLMGDAAARPLKL
jgi:hypothetical protein